MANVNTNWFTGLPKWLQVILVLLGLFVIRVIVRKVRMDGKKRGTQSNNEADAAELMAQSGANLNSGSALQRVLELKEIAQNISSAFWSFTNSLGGFWVGWRLDEDEELAIQELNKCRDGKEAAFVSDYYTEYNSTFNTQTITSGQKGKSLLADCKKFLDSSERARVKSEVLNSLK